MIRTAFVGALALLVLTAAAFAWPTDDQAWKTCKAWALGQLAAPGTAAFSDISMQNAKDNFITVFFAVDSRDSTGAGIREYGRCITDGTAIKDFSSHGGETEPILKAWVLDRSDARRRLYVLPPGWIAGLRLWPKARFVTDAPCAQRRGAQVDIVARRSARVDQENAYRRLSRGSGIVG